MTLTQLATDGTQSDEWSGAKYITPDALAKIDSDIRALKSLSQLSAPAEGFLRCSLSILYMRGFEQGAKAAFAMESMSIQPLVESAK